MRDRIIQAGVKNLREFGYPNCTANSVFNDTIHRAFFRKMVEGTRDEAPEGGLVWKACLGLLAELDAADLPAPQPKPTKARRKDR